MVSLKMLIYISAKKETGDEATGSNGDDGHNSGESSRDNRDLIDRRENQKLTKEEINQLRKDGLTGNVSVLIMLMKL